MISADTTKKTLAILYSCGMYNHSGEWACTVGLPSKSGVSGGLFLVVPGLLGIAMYSPPIDANGNSVKAMHLARRVRFLLFTKNKKTTKNQNPKKFELADKVTNLLYLFCGQLATQYKWNIFDVLYAKESGSA